ncbi:transposable element Tc1 transposase [Trichonephila clavipes]|nr:transposable element Tc1 transposase [Trichonephila clavipes]
MNDGETSSRRHDVGSPHTIKLTLTLREIFSQEGEYHNGAKQQTSLSCAFADQASSPTAPLRDWSIDQWERAALSDESEFVIHHADKRVRIRRLPCKQLLPQCTVCHTQAGGGSIMLWGRYLWRPWGPWLW